MGLRISTLKIWLIDNLLFPAFSYLTTNDNKKMRKSVVIQKRNKYNYFYNNNLKNCL